jgi:3-hydroxyisobutyrate dehydrogenase
MNTSPWNVNHSLKVIKMTQFGFIGLGNMGFPMASNLLKARHQVYVFDMNENTLKRAAETGMQLCSSLRDLGDMAETTFLSLPKGDNVMAVLSKAAGLTDGKKLKRIIDFSTIGPEAAIKASEILKTDDIQYIDSPVSGGTLGAAKATLAIMTSCNRVDHDVPPTVGNGLATARRSSNATLA